MSRGVDEGVARVALGGGVATPLGKGVNVRRGTRVGSVDMRWLQSKHPPGRNRRQQNRNPEVSEKGLG